MVVGEDDSGSPAPRSRLQLAPATFTAVDPFNAIRARPPSRCSAHGGGNMGTRLGTARLDFFSAKRRTSWLTMTVSVSPSYVSGVLRAGCRMGAVQLQIFGQW